MAGRQHDSSQRGEGGVVLQLELEPGEPLTGLIAVDGQSGKRFCGWIELMAAVNAARQCAVDEVRSH